MTSPPRPLASSLTGVLWGIAALILVTAILVAAVSSSSSDDKTSDLLARIEKVQDRQDEQARLAADNERQRLARSRALMHQAEVTQFRLRQQQNYTLLLVRILRRNGLEVPAEPPAESSKPSADPKAPKPRPTSPGTPTPTGPSPSAPSPDACVLLPVLCIPPLPTALPTLLP